MRALRVALGALGLILWPGLATAALLSAGRDWLAERAARTHPQLEVAIASELESWLNPKEAPT